MYQRPAFLLLRTTLSRILSLLLLSHLLLPAASTALVVSSRQGVSTTWKAGAEVEAACVYRYTRASKSYPQLTERAIFFWGSGYACFLTRVTHTHTTTHLPRLALLSLSASSPRQLRFERACSCCARRGVDVAFGAEREVRGRELGLFLSS